MPIDKFTRMARSLPALYKAETNTMVRGLLKAWGLNDDEIEIQITNTKAQIFQTDAEGRYLDFLGNNVGVPRDPALGMADDDFRKLIPVMSFLPKQVRRTIISLLDVFWGPGFTRANVNSGNVEDFNFGPVSILTGTATFTNKDKTVKGVGTMFLTELQPGDYIKVNLASGYTYQKVSAILSDTVVELSVPWASAIAVNVSMDKGVTRTLSYVIDANPEKTIRFIPSAFDDITSVKVDEIVTFLNNHPEHSQYLTASKYIDPIVGNKLNIRTNTPGLLGSIQITGGDANDVSRLYFDLTKHTEVTCSVYEINPNEIVVKIPSSVPVLRRTLRGAVHPKQDKIQIFSEAEVYDFTALGASSTLNITVDGTPHVITFTHASDFSDITSVTAEEIVTVINDQLAFLEAFTEDRENFKKVGLRTTFGSIEYQVTGGTANTILNFDTTLQQDPDLIQADYPSAYVFNPTGQLFTVTGVNTELNANIPAGSVQTSISVVSASDFPNRPGKILFDFGRNTQEGPIAYNSRPNNSTLLIDASYTFQNEHPIGRKVNLIYDQPTIPRLTGVDYPAYVVGTEEARAAAQKLIKQLLAAGVVIRFIIEFPEALFECVCRDCGPTTDTNYQGALTGQGPLVF